MSHRGDDDQAIRAVGIGDEYVTATTRPVQDEADGDEVSVGFLDPFHEVGGPAESDRVQRRRHDSHTLRQVRRAPPEAVALNGAGTIRRDGDLAGDHHVGGALDAVKEAIVTAFFSASTLSMCSHGRSRSVRPKCP